MARNDKTSPEAFPSSDSTLTTSSHAQQDLRDIEALLAHQRSSRERDLRQFQEQHATLQAVAEAFNLLCDQLCLGKEEKIVLKQPTSFLPTRPSLNEIVTEVVCEKKELFTNVYLHEVLRGVEDSSQFSELTPSTFLLILPLLVQWLGNPKEAQHAFTLIHEGVRLFGDIQGDDEAVPTTVPGSGTERENLTTTPSSVLVLTKTKQDRRLWRTAVAALCDLREDTQTLMDCNIPTEALYSLEQAIRGMIQM